MGAHLIWYRASGTCTRCGGDAQDVASTPQDAEFFLRLGHAEVKRCGFDGEITVKTIPGDANGPYTRRQLEEATRRQPRRFSVISGRRGRY
ncbi:hypothetical protein D6827_01050 [Candidatus Parcubacteria bacterium]|nr:MAG: hypothetical protein D6827_01050 [Candidatus Parcubacteria bacterium]